ncbi:hypothetical protein BJV77DRAFT_521206 [Russula vinacea]|nr:hypothetical protein BJV77DRAFT_521206 [Russula vinacea]
MITYRSDVARPARRDIACRPFLSSLSTLCPLSSLSRKWFYFFSENQSVIFHNAAVFHGYTHPGTLLLEDALSVHKGSPWEGATDWKDFCRRSVQFHRNWEGNGRVVARLLKPPGCDVHRLKVDEKAEILIATHMIGGLSVTHLFSGVLLWSLPRFYVRSYAHCEYENGYLVFDRFEGEKEVWRLASDFADGEPEEAPHAPPDEKQRRAHAFFPTAIHPRTDTAGTSAPGPRCPSPRSRARTDSRTRRSSARARIVHFCMMCARARWCSLLTLALRMCAMLMWTSDMCLCASLRCCVCFRAGMAGKRSCAYRVMFGSRRSLVRRVSLIEIRLSRCFPWSLHSMNALRSS